MQPPTGIVSGLFGPVEGLLLPSAPAMVIKWAAGIAYTNPWPTFLLLAVELALIALAFPSVSRARAPRRVQALVFWVVFSVASHFALMGYLDLSLGV